jgi:hypothetical protein
MVSVGVSEPVMMELVEKRGAMPLTADDLVALKKAGASDVLIQHMIASEKKAPDPSTLPPPGYAYPPATYWGPSIGFSFGVGYYYSSGSGHSHGGSGYSGKR